MTQGWIRAFLTGRTQRVRVEGEFSSWAQVKSGIPEGSVLGPTLFVMYINDMPDAINSMCQLIADDAKIFKSVRSTDDNKKLQDDLDSLTEWSTRWQLPFNDEKCKSLHIGRNNRKHIYEMDGKELDQVNPLMPMGRYIGRAILFYYAYGPIYRPSIYTVLFSYLFFIFQHTTLKLRIQVRDSVN